MGLIGKMYLRLIDEEASGGNRTVLYRASLEKFLGRRLNTSHRRWKPGRPNDEYSQDDDCPVAHNPELARAETG